MKTIINNKIKQTYLKLLPAYEVHENDEIFITIINY